MQKENQITEIKNTNAKRQEIPNTQKKDSSAKLIFNDPILCAQFLEGYVDIPLLKNIKPSDIEDVSNRYVHMFTEERNSDIVKRVWVKDKRGKKSPFYIISLIEHKNKVDYNVTMQILRYMVYIWEEYEKEMEKKHKVISRTKGFCYLPVLPIIFYDGFQNWTASTQLKDRILLSNTLLKYIPDFDCILVQLKDYSNTELMKRKNELSIVMMIDKLQSADDFKTLEQETNPVYIQESVKNAPEYLLDIMAQIVEVFLAKLNIPQKEIDEFAGHIKERNMAELFANFKGYDVQAARAEAKRLGWAEGHAAGHAEGLAELSKERESGIEKFIKAMLKFNIPQDMVCQQLMEQYDLSESESFEKITLYWK